MIRLSLKSMEYLKTWAEENYTAENRDTSSVEKDGVISNHIIYFLSHIESCLDMYFQDILKCFQGGGRLGVFQQCCSFIDLLSTYCQNKSSQHNVFEDYLESYLPSYHGKKFYELFRSKLVHNYSEQGFVLSEVEELGHLDLKEGKLVINITRFLDDIKKAYEQYLIDLKNSEKLIENAVLAHKSNPLIRQQEYPINTDDVKVYTVIASASTSTPRNRW